MRRFSYFLALLIFTCALSQSSTSAQQFFAGDKKFERKITRQIKNPDDTTPGKNFISKIKNTGSKNSVMESTLLDSIYSYQFNSLTDSLLIEKIYNQYNWDENIVL